MGIVLQLNDLVAPVNNLGNGVPYKNYFDLGNVTDSARQAIYKQLYTDLVSNNLYGQLEQLLVLTENAQSSMLNFIKPTSEVSTYGNGTSGSTIFTQNGFKGNTASSGITSNTINPLITILSGTDDYMFGVYVTSGETTSEGNTFLVNAGDGGASGNWPTLSNALGSANGGYGLGTGLAAYSPADTGTGLSCVNRKDGVVSLYKGGLLKASTTDQPVLNADTSILVMPRSNATIQFFVAGKSLTKAQHATLNTIFSKFVTNYGAL